MQAFLVAACALGILVGMRLSRGGGADQSALNEETFAGTWQLQSVNGNRVGPRVDSAVISQQVTFSQGRVHGVTVLRADTEAGTTAMPFPDQSVTEVTASADGHDVTVVWDGTYTLLDKNRADLRIGRAGYRAVVAPDPVTHHLEFDHDTILTYPGRARYRAVRQVAQRPAS